MQGSYASLGGHSDDWQARDSFSSSTGRTPDIRHQRTIVCLGAPGVGKSSLIKQYVYDQFSAKHVPTIQDTYRKEAYWNGNPIDLAIRDTTGYKEGATSRVMIGAGAHGYIIMYSVARRETLELAEQLHDDLLTNLLGSAVDMPLVLVGNKTDLVAERQVSVRDAQAVAAKWGCPLIEASAMNNTGVDEVFSTILSRIYRNEYSPPTKSGLFSCNCRVESWRAAKKKRVRKAYMVCLGLIMVLSVVAAIAALGYLLSDKEGHDDISTFLLFGLGGFGILISGIGLYGGYNLSSGAIKLSAIAMVLLTIAHCVFTVFALNDPIFSKWLKSGGSKIMVCASILDVLVQILAAVLALLVFGISAETIEEGYGLTDTAHVRSSPQVTRSNSRRTSWTLPQFRVNN